MANSASRQKYNAQTQIMSYKTKRVCVSRVMCENERKFTEKGILRPELQNTKQKCEKLRSLK
jgi:hypothetical protein